MFFCVSKEKLVEALSSLRMSNCAYRDDKNPNYPRCDCKYGYDYNKRRTGGEQNGCPELSCAREVIEAMSPHEWNRILKRLRKAKKFHIAGEYFSPEPKKKKARKKA